MFSKLEAAKKHYEVVGLGADFVNQFVSLATKIKAQLREKGAGARALYPGRAPRMWSSYSTSIEHGGNLNIGDSKARGRSRRKQEHITVVGIHWSRPITET